MRDRKPIEIENSLPTANPAGGVRLGLVRAEGLDPQTYPPAFEDALGAAVAREAAGLSTPDAEVVRLAARDMLRNGTYKPTGRGKPASEYLARAAGEDFPRINSLADVNNLVSLEAHLPISMWDLDSVPAGRYAFRLGGPDEEYVFNAGGQVLGLRDLVSGCRVTAESGPAGEPIVTPVKDCQAAKTHDGTERVVTCVYAPANLVSESTLAEVCARLAGWLTECGRMVEVATAVASPGALVEL